MSPRTASNPVVPDTATTLATMRRWLLGFASVVTVLFGITTAIFAWGWRLRGARDDVVTRADLRDVTLFILADSEITEEMIDELRQSIGKSGESQQRWNDLVTRRRQERARLLGSITASDHRLSF